jgi:hypothetical protein
MSVRDCLEKNSRPRHSRYLASRNPLPITSVNFENDPADGAELLSSVIRHPSSICRSSFILDETCGLILVNRMLQAHALGRGARTGGETGTELVTDASVPTSCGSNRLCRCPASVGGCEKLKSQRNRLEACVIDAREVLRAPCQRLTQRGLRNDPSEEKRRGIQPIAL